MKKFFFAAIAMTVMLASCSKNAENLSTVEPVDGPQVYVTLQAENQSRAFFDNTATAEAWEKSINSLDLYVFDKNGNIVLKRKLSSSEINAKSARFALPNSTAGTQCSFYVVANADCGEAITVSALDNALESAVLGDYNGTFAQVSTASKRTGGFVMTGKTNQAIATAGSSTTVGVTLKRVVAKISVRAKLSSDFSQNYNGGKIIITGATISQANSKSYYFANVNGPLEKSTFFSFTQPSQNTSDNFDNLFYIYENGVESTEKDRVKIVLKGYFDADGNLATTHDQIEVEYPIYLSGASNGEIRRNGYYRVDATIKGLSGDGLVVNFSVAEWETPVTQNIELGS